MNSTREHYRRALAAAVADAPYAARAAVYTTLNSAIAAAPAAARARVDVAARAWQAAGRPRPPLTIFQSPQPRERHAPALTATENRNEL